MIKIAFFSFIVALRYLLGLEITPDRADVVYYNREFVQFLKVTIGRSGRRKPYGINVHYRSLVDVDNNYTLTVCLKEKMSSGQYHPTPLQFSSQLCVFFDEEQFVGKIIMQKLNVSCPTPAGEYRYNNVMFDFLENFPYFMPFAWAHQVSAQALFDLSLYRTASRDVIYNISLYITVMQKPKSRKPRS